MYSCYQIIDLIIKAIALLATAIGVIYAAVTYAKNTRLEKAKWLNQLYEKFFESGTYTKTRELLDYNDSPSEKYNQLKDLVDRKSDSEPELQEQLVIYLNFFEYIATLWKREQLGADDVHMMFGYYLKNLEKHSWLIAFAEKNDFKNLPALIAAVKKLDVQK